MEEGEARPGSSGPCYLPEVQRATGWVGGHCAALGPAGGGAGPDCWLLLPRLAGHPAQPGRPQPSLPPAAGSFSTVFSSPVACLPSQGESSREQTFFSWDPLSTSSSQNDAWHVINKHLSNEWVSDCIARPVHSSPLLPPFLMGEHTQVAPSSGRLQTSLP